MRAFFLLLFSLCVARQVNGTSFVFLSPEEYLSNSTIIAIGRVGPVQSTVAPGGILVRSSTVKVEQIIYWRHAEMEPAPKEFVLYEVDPHNGAVAGLPFLVASDEGRCLLFLEMQGVNKFCPFDPLSVQRIENGKIRWPLTAGRREEVPVEHVIQELQTLMKKAERATGD